MLEIHIPGDERILCVVQTPWRKRPSIAFRTGGTINVIGNINPEDADDLAEWLEKLAKLGPHRIIDPEDDA